MRFTLTVDLNNSAFEDPDELPRILRRVADDLGLPVAGDDGSARDLNGNTVGRWLIVA